MIRFQASDGEVRLRELWNGNWIVSTRRRDSKMYFFEFGVNSTTVERIRANRELMEWSIHG